MSGTSASKELKVNVCGFPLATRNEINTLGILRNSATISNKINNIDYTVHTNEIMQIKVLEHSFYD